MKNKKAVIGITSIVAVLLVIIGVTYAYWLLTKTQAGQNLISSGCLDISLNGEKNDITLTEQFPLSDEDGMKLVPYEFTVTNNCNTSVDYQVNLESIGDSTNAIKASAIKVALNDDLKLLTAGGNAEPTISGAYESNKLVYGTLAGKSAATVDDQVTYKLRIWIDADAPISEQNKTFRSKISVTIGQGITNPYKEGTLAYDILSNYGGASAITTLSAEWQEGDASAVVASSVYIGTGVSYYFWYGTEYKFDTETGNYTLSGTLTQARLEQCQMGIINCGKYTLRSADIDYGTQTIYEVTDFSSEEASYYVTAKTIKAYNGFSNPTTASDAGLYKAQDDLGTSYYFRGAPTNNYVKFGTYAKDTTLTVGEFGSYSTKEVSITAGTPMYWRIVRINGDGTIRLVYDGTEPVSNGVAHIASIASVAYNSSEDAKYLGYTYNDGTKEVDSVIKDTVDNWYADNLNLKYGKYIADSIFCNDRNSRLENDYVYYGAYDRLEYNKTPLLTCKNISDRYTINGYLGNGLLKYPVGLITADEVVMAGGAANNNSFYLYNNYLFWTLSPYYYRNVGNSQAWFVDEYGKIYRTYGISWPVPGARPVINLKADVKFTGNGRIDTNSPYEIVMN